MNKDNPFYPALTESLDREREEDLETIEVLSKKKKRTFAPQNSKVDSKENKINSCADVRKNKMVIEFNDHKSSSVKSIVVNANTSIKCTTRFMSRKLLMFAKLSLKRFIYSLVEMLNIPEENPIVAQIYDKHSIEKIVRYHVLTDTDSTSLQFMTISDPTSSYPECDMRDILFKIFSSTEIRDRFDKSYDFWRRFGVHCPQNQKVFDLYEVEHIDDPC